ncbi:MAG: PEP-CTERM sorting domain-containing protein [Desulfobulbaceae bacterium]|nr:PEP-CTERM sorting domain-containing protein [Desulfobulbaceae bacterium]
MKKSITTLLLLGMSSLWCASAQALTIDLNYEFDGDLPTTNSYGTVEITESGGDLNFVITANTVLLGSDADIHEFYFNLINAPTNLAITLGAPVSTLDDSPTIAGGGNLDFDYSINFGDGAPSYDQVSFTLSAVQTLSISDLYQWSYPNNTPQVLMAVHFQATTENNLIGMGDSETIGGDVAPVPEPATMLLFGTGLAGLAGFARKKYSSPTS